MIRRILAWLGLVAVEPYVFTCQLCGHVVRAFTERRADHYMMTHCQTRHPEELAAEVRRLRGEA